MGEEAKKHAKREGEELERRTDMTSLAKKTEISKMGAHFQLIKR